MRKEDIVIGQEYIYHNPDDPKFRSPTLVVVSYINPELKYALFRGHEGYYCNVRYLHEVRSIEETIREFKIEI